MLLDRYPNIEYAIRQVCLYYEHANAELEWEKEKGADLIDGARTEVRPWGITQTNDSLSGNLRMFYRHRTHRFLKKNLRAG